MIARIANRVWAWILDFIFPQFCVNCGKFGQLLCPSCFGQLEFHTSPIRLVLPERHLDSVWACCVYKGAIKKLIKALKYQSIKDAAAVCGQLLYYCSWPPQDIECLTAVPIHPKRRRERGFNQAEIIAQTLAQLMNKPYLPLLQRLHHTPQLAKLKHRQDRLKQLEHQIGINPAFSHKTPLRVLIIDDVVTSGATLNECAKVLKQHGATCVDALCVAHGM